MRRIYYKNGTSIDVKNNQSWEYENDPGWKKTEDISENKCQDGARIPNGGCFGCNEGDLCA